MANHGHAWRRMLLFAATTTQEVERHRTTLSLGLLYQRYLQHLSYVIYKHELEL